MSVTFNLPADIEEMLRRLLPNLDEAAKESFVVTLYREGKLTLHELAVALGVSGYEAEGILKRHRVSEDLLTPEEFAAERAKLDRPADPR